MSHQYLLYRSTVNKFTSSSRIMVFCLNLVRVILKWKNFHLFLGSLSLYSKGSLKLSCMLHKKLWTYFFYCSIIKWEVYRAVLQKLTLNHNFGVRFPFFWQWLSKFEEIFSAFPAINFICKYLEYDFMKLNLAEAKYKNVSCSNDRHSNRPNVAEHINLGKASKKCKRFILLINY